MRRLAPIEPLRRGGTAQNDILRSPDESPDTATPGKPNNTRAAHACESCRFLKVRCLSHNNSSIRKCQRCARLNQECLTKPRAPRKPRKRTDTRVGELERQVEALRAAFGESSAANKSVCSATDSNKRSTLPNNQEHALMPEVGAFENASPISPQAGLQVPLSPCGIIRGPFPQSPRLSVASLSSGTLTPSIAINLFNKYKTELMQHFPLSLFADTEDASMVRVKSPTLFLAIITAAAGDYDLELHSTLNDQLAQDFAKRIIVDGEKSIELVQALLTAAVFYHPPDAFEKLKYYQYIHMAGTMTTDIGLGNSGGPATPSGPWEFRSRYGEDERERNASRRTLIASYMSCLSVGRGLRRPSMIQSENATEQCIEALQKSSYVVAQDHQLIAWARLESIMKEVTRLLGLSGSDSPADLADVRTQCTIIAFDNRLERWKKELSPGVIHPTLEIMYHYSKIYLHEIAFHYDGSVEDFRPPFRLKAPSNTSYNLPDLHTARLDSVIVALTSVHSLLDVLLQLPARTLRVFPTFMYIRASYAIFILLKIFFTSNAPGSKLGKVLHPSSVKVEDYLNRLVSHMQTANVGGNCRLTTRFYHIFSRSRDWFRKQVLRTSCENGAVDQDLFEPFRLLSLNDEPEPSQAECPVEMPDLHQRAAARIGGLHLDTMNSTDKDGKTRNSWSTGAEPNQLDRDALASSTAAWQYPTPWSSQYLPLDTMQAESGMSEPQLGSLFMEDPTQIALSEADNIMDDSFDLAVGFDLDSHFWDFDMGDITFEPT